MKWKNADLKTRLYLVTVIILLAGLGSAGVIYLTAGSDSDSTLDYETAGGEVYQVRPEESKTYIHDLEVYGGKENVLADEFMRWFAGLWSGRSLATTVACISIFISFLCFFAAHRLPHDLKADAGEVAAPGGHRK
jgi:hypothetical protein